MPTSFNASVNASVIEEFRANEGKVGGPFEGGNLLLLTTTGARSGTARTTPLGYVRHGGSLLLVASNLGAPDHPAWYRNLLAHPVVDVEIGTSAYQALAIPAEGARRDELFALVVREAPGYGDYQAATNRTLPVVVLEPAEPDDGSPREVRTLADKILEVHDQLRLQLRLVTADVDAHFAALAAHDGPGEPPAPGLGLQIRQRCLAFCQALEFHHTSEDGHLFPGIARYHPHLTDVFDRLRAEHRTVARVQEGLVALLADIGAADPPRFRAELARMTTELTAHLDYEEETILPLVADVPWPPAGAGPGPEPVSEPAPQPGVRVVEFDHLVLNVRDVERALDFYCGPLGLAPVRVDEWRAGKVPFPSVRVSATTIIDLFARPPGDSGESNVDHICLVVEPLDWREVLDAGTFTVLDGPVDRFGARGDARSVYVRDPDGNTVELRWYPQDVPGDAVTG